MNKMINPGNPVSRTNKIKELAKHTTILPIVKNTVVKPTSNKINLK